MIEVLRDSLLWLAGIELVGLAVLPLALRVFFALPDRGYAMAKMLGLVLVAYLTWVTGILGFTSFTGPTVVITTLLIAAASWILWGQQLRGSWSSMRSLALGSEAVFVLTFLIAVAVRSYNAPIAGQEKQMDMTFLNSLVGSRALPAPDLWLSGFGMPYYYFGYLIQSLLGKVLPVPTAAAYNLAVATVLALAAIGAFGIGSSLVQLAGGGKRAAIGLGVFGAFALTLMGNMEALFELIASTGVGDTAFWAAIGIKNLQANTGGFPPADGGWWFRAARVIPNIQPDGIDEFPYFSFLLGDLHPHYMAIPLAILIVALGCQQLIVGRSLRSDPIRLAVTAVVLGAVIPFNTWDVPIFWGVFALGLLVTAAREPEPIGALVDRLKDLVAVVLLAVTCYVPYFVGYVSQPLGLGIVDERTMFGSLFVLFGPLLILALMGGAAGLMRESAGEEQSIVATAALALGAVLGLALAALGQPTLGFLAASLIYWVALTWLRVRRPDVPSVQLAVGLLAIAGLGSILIPEVIFLRDVFNSRMNSVFKFYYDAWILLAVASPVIAWELVLAVREAAGASALSIAARPLAALSLALVAVFAAGGAIYPVAATASKSRGAVGAPTLDGMVHLRMGSPDDAAAIDWLRGTYAGAGIVEAVGNDYSDAGRFSTFAGMRTLVGWVGHEVQWRGATPAVDQRKELARRIYSGTDPALWRDEAAKANMRFVVVGSLERELYGQEAGANLEKALPLVKQFGATKVYELTDKPIEIAERAK